MLAVMLSQLCDIWAAQAAEGNGTARIEVICWFEPLKLKSGMMSAEKLVTPRSFYGGSLAPSLIIRCIPSN